MASRSKLLPVAALGVALAFFWCYALAGPAYMAVGDDEVGVMAPLSPEVEKHQPNIEFPPCSSCPTLTAKTELPSVGLSPETVHSVVAMVFPSPPVSVAGKYFLPTRGFALNRTSLFHKSILIRI